MSKKEKKTDIASEQVEEQLINEAEKVEQLQEEIKLEKDKFLRLFAEFENYKRRTSKERIELFKTASQDVMVALLPILDDFDRAYTEISKSEEKELLKGVELINNKLKNTLKLKGLEEIELVQGDAFNADNHEAITQIPAPTEDLKGKIIDVVEKGYKLGDKTIRFPKVVIGQ
ncbi:nucleotide exchange factor GrpE [Formosa maritima]|uniref:Protein GrpE n=1 Tax=Formosa maritima TaxID=2592046 RepID=A0A5D0GFM6_9FLAO|nr:nucleotide exchange factor GrpE [Formosa maritima]TYA57530.1 nucleotide exchange factor GrpE [Formosa maritima]